MNEKRTKKPPKKIDYQKQRQDKLAWCRKAARDIRLCAWKNDMSREELDALAHGLMHGFPDDGTQEGVA